MTKILRFHKKPNLKNLEGLSINGTLFKEGDGMIQDSTLVMDIPKTFRFKTYLEVFTYSENKGGMSDLIMTERLTRDVEYWEMGDAFARAGFRTPEIEEQMKVLCQSLVDNGLAYWTEKEWI